MSEKEDRKSKRSPNTQNTPKSRHNSKHEIEEVYLKVLYTMDIKNYPNIRKGFNRTL